MAAERSAEIGGAFALCRPPEARAARYQSNQLEGVNLSQAVLALEEADRLYVRQVQRVIRRRGPGRKHQSPVGNRHVAERIIPEARRAPVCRLDLGRL